MLRIENSFWSLEIVPQMGASIVSCEYHDFPVLEAARPKFKTEHNVFGASCFPLIPYSNRIGEGQFSFHGDLHKIKPNHPRHKFPIHGNSWSRSWSVIEQTKSSCHLAMVYEPDTHSWPWAYQSKQNITIKDQTLTFELSIKNIGHKTCPAGLGLHPFFSNAASAQIEFEAKHMWQCGKNLIPTRAICLTEDTGFSNLKVISGKRFDNCFSGWNGKARINWLQFDRHVEMKADPIFSNIVTYIQPENSFFCLEPVSHINNALNLKAAEQMDVLKPGETLTGSIRFTGL